MLLSVLKIYLIHNHIITRGTWNSMQVEAPQLFLVKQAFVNEPQPRRRHFLGRRVGHPAVLPKHDQLLVQRGAAGLHEADEFARGPAGDSVRVGTQRDLFGPQPGARREEDILQVTERCAKGGEGQQAGRHARVPAWPCVRRTSPGTRCLSSWPGARPARNKEAQHKERSQSPWI